MSSDPVLDWPRSFGFGSAEARATDGTRLQLVVAGPSDGRRIVLLHGAPQFSYTWRRVIPLLAERYRVIVPDLRGYGASDLARNGRYDLEILADDVGAVLDATSRGGDDRPILVGHDWGGAIAWTFAGRHPARLRHLVAVNGPHPAAYARELGTRAQAIRSWYVGFLNVPGVARLMSATDARPMLWMMKASAPPGTFTDAELALYRHALARPGRAEAAVAYYRQAFGGPSPLAKVRALLATSPRIDLPATVLWGEDDKAIAPSHPDAVRRYASRLEIRRLSGVSHWVPEERPADCARAILEADGVS